MGNWNSGRRPTPTQLKILRGNPGKRPINPDEPHPGAEDAEALPDDPPPELRGDVRARAEWKRVAPILRSYGLIADADRATVIALCLEWSTYLDAKDHVRKSGRTVSTNSGPRPSPHITIADTALSHCHRLWAELGLTPSGRAKVARLPPGRRDPAPTTIRGKWSGTGL